MPTTRRDIRRIYQPNEPAEGSFLLTVSAPASIISVEDEHGPEDLRAALFDVLVKGPLLVSGACAWGTNEDGSHFVSLVVDPPESMRRTESFLRGKGFRTRDEVEGADKKPKMRVTEWRGRHAK